MKLSELKRLDDVIEEHRADPAFREQWDESSFARAVAIRIVKYRADKGLSQEEFGTLVGLKQPAVSRLETGEHEPTLAILKKITTAIGLEFDLSITHGDVFIAT